MFSQYLREAIRVYQQKGVNQLARSIYKLLRYLPYDLYRACIGYRIFKIDGVSAEIAVPDHSAARSLRFAHQNEHEFIKILLDELRSGDVFWDVGSHIGAITALAAESHPSTHVIAFEPFPPNIVALQDTVDRIDGAVVDIIRQPLSNEVAENTLFIPDLPGTRGQTSLIEDIGTNSIQVQCTTGDELIRSGRVPTPNVIKLDVEGAENAVLDGMEGILKSEECRAIFCEVHEPTSLNFKNLKNKMNKYYFDTELINDRNLEIQIVGRRTESLNPGK